MFRIIPEDNKYKNQIKEIFELCEKAIPEYGDNSSYFKEPVSEQEMVDWEEKNNIKIPESYKEWLRFTGDCQMVISSANLWGPSKFRQEYEDLVVIGEIVGDGEVICFSKSTGNYASFFEGEVNMEFDDFKSLLNEIMRLLGKKDKEYDTRIAELMLKFMKKKGVSDVNEYIRNIREDANKR